MKLVDLVKDVYTDFDLTVRGYLFSRNDDLVAKIRKQGLAVKPGYIDSGACKLLVDEINGFIDENQCRIWKDELGADKRIFGFEHVSKVLPEVVDVKYFKNVGELYMGRKLTHYFVMAAHLDAVQGNLGSGGGWHRDSAFRHQFKAIVYLSDVTKKNGPFQYLSGSHTTISKINLLRKFPLEKTRFNIPDIDLADPSLVTLESPAGTVVFADTRGIHRGKPIEEGCRLALTYYFWTSLPPEHFTEFLQGPVSLL